MAYVDPYHPNAQGGNPYSPLMTPSSAGNPASSYGSSGGAVAGPAGTHAPVQTVAGPQEHGGSAPTPAPTQPSAPPVANSGATAQWPVYTPPAGSGLSIYGTPGNYVTGGGGGQYYNGQPNNAVQFYPNLPYENTNTTTPSAYQGGGAQYPAPPPAYVYDATGKPIPNPAFGQWYQSLTPDQKKAADNEFAARQQLANGQPATGTAGDPAQPDSTNWDTNGFAKPAFVVQGASRYAMPGWDNAKWNNPNHQSPKYVVGRMLSTLAPTTANMDAATALLAKAYPGTTRVGNGDVQIPGVGVVDILMGAGQGGRGWWWGDAATVANNAANDKAKQQAASAPQGVDPYTAMMMALLNPPKAAAPAAPAAPPPPDPKLALLQQQLDTARAERDAAARRTNATANMPGFTYY